MATVKTRQVNVKLPEDVVEAIKELAKRNNTTHTEIIRRAVMLEKLVDDTVRVDKGEVILRKGDVDQHLVFR